MHPRHGFIVDQPFFGVGTADRHQDLLYARHWFADRLTPDYLPLGYVQGGALTLRLTGPDAGSIWFADADDPRDDERLNAATYCAELLSFCAPDLDTFLSELTTVPQSLLKVVDQRLASVPEAERRSP